MPTYLYGCPECGSTKEVWHSIVEDPQVRCVDCTCVMVRRPAATAISFKGEGFYSKDKNSD
jgi:putative FmdB family regulatory protein